MGSAPGRAFDGKNTDMVESGVANLGGQFLRVMEIRGGEISGMFRRIVMLAGCQVGGDDGAKLLVLKCSSRESVDERGEAGDGGGKYDASGLRIRRASRNVRRRSE